MIHLPAGGCFVGWPGEGLFIFSEPVTQQEKRGKNRSGLTFPQQAHASTQGSGGCPQPLETMLAFSLVQLLLVQLHQTGLNLFHNPGLVI